VAKGINVLDVYKIRFPFEIVVRVQFSPDQKLSIQASHLWLRVKAALHQGNNWQHVAANILPIVALV
jgi:hypothetical protein